MKSKQPAFPIEFTEEIKNGHKRTGYYLGLTTRQYYAAKAMQGFLSGEWTGAKDDEKLAKDCFEIADALIAFEEKEGKE